MLKFLLNVWGHVVDFEAVFVSDDISFSGSCISTENNSILENKTSDGCSGLHRFGAREAFLEHKLISVI